jgi:hypothetical protein
LQIYRLAACVLGNIQYRNRANQTKSKRKFQRFHSISTFYMILREIFFEPTFMRQPYQDTVFRTEAVLSAASFSDSFPADPALRSGICCPFVIPPKPKCCPPGMRQHTKNRCCSRALQHLFSIFLL